MLPHNAIAQDGNSLAKCSLCLYQVKALNLLGLLRESERICVLQLQQTIDRNILIFRQQHKCLSHPYT